ncbi:Protein of unknown function [Parapedobacter indicus]|uniref:DUF3823 domain-containing protein n=2 Tax=Parapedobacter indicus TaxID=1477437 RepID=A0A1I3NBR6_9SPHI|nr:uncharacterized protein DUF3823 [Parapedobacter indicus]SFJ06771.1 Protein of unknown function [Parapedobacter indicus]
MIMKKIWIVLLPLALMAGGCGFDNYDEPQSKLFGRVTYNGEALGVRGTGEAVQLQLYQDGYELRNPIPVYVAQDGTFEATLFDGEYKLVTRDNNGPWVNDRDTTVVDLRGTTNVDIEVTPYFTLSDVSLALNGNALSASFQIDQVVEDGAVDYAMILVSKTAFVDDVVYIVREDLSDPEAGTTITQSVDLSGNGDFNAGAPLFARVGVRPVGKDQAIYSQVVKLR